MVVVGWDRVGTGCCGSAAASGPGAAATTGAAGRLRATEAKAREATGPRERHDDEQQRRTRAPDVARQPLREVGRQVECGRRRADEPRQEHDEGGADRRAAEAPEAADDDGDDEQEREGERVRAGAHRLRHEAQHGAAGAGRHRRSRLKAATLTRPARTPFSRAAVSSSRTARIRRPEPAAREHGERRDDDARHEDRHPGLPLLDRDDRAKEAAARRRTAICSPWSPRKTPENTAVTAGRATTSASVTPARYGTAQARGGEPEQQTRALPRRRRGDDSRARKRGTPSTPASVSAFAVRAYPYPPAAMSAACPSESCPLRPDQERQAGRRAEERRDRRELEVAVRVEQERAADREDGERGAEDDRARDAR